MDTTHLTVNASNVTATVNNPDVTLDDLEALYFSLCNNERYGEAHWLTELVIKKIGDLQ